MKVIAALRDGTTHLYSHRGKFEMSVGGDLHGPIAVSGAAYEITPDDPAPAPHDDVLSDAALRKCPHGVWPRVETFSYAGAIYVCGCCGNAYGTLNTGSKRCGACIDVALRKQQPFEYSPGPAMDQNENARQRGEIASLKLAIAHQGKKADEDAGRLKRYSEALYEIAHKPAPDGNLRKNGGFEEFAEYLQGRASQELSATVMVGYPEGPAA